MPCNYFRPLTSSRLRLYSILPSPVVVRKQNPSTPFISYTKLPPSLFHIEEDLAASACTIITALGLSQHPSLSTQPPGCHTLSLLVLELAASMEVIHLTTVHIHPLSTCPSGNPKIYPSKMPAIYLHAF